MSFQEQGIEVSHELQSLGRQKSQITQKGFTTITRAAATISLFSGLGAASTDAVEGNVEATNLKKGRLGKIRIVIQSNTMDGILTLTIRKNQADTLVVFTVPAINSVDQESGLFIDLDPLDTFDINIEAPSVTGTIVYKCFSILEINA